MIKPSGVLLDVHTLSIDEFFAFVAWIPNSAQKCGSFGLDGIIQGCYDWHILIQQ